MARPLIWTHTIAGERLVPIHDLGELAVEDRLADVESLTFLMRAGDPKAFAVIPDTLIEYDGRYYRIEEIRQYREGPRPLVEVYCEARWLDLGKRVRAGSFSALGQSAADGLDAILAGSGWTGDVDPPISGLYSVEDLDASALALLRRWAGIVGAEILFDTAAKTVTLVDRLGVDRGLGFRWGHNLRSIDRRYRPPVATRLFPFGANDLEITGVNPAGTRYIEDFSWYTAQGLTVAEARAEYLKEQIWIDQRYLLALNLYDAAVRRLERLAQPTISYELTVADFSRLTGSTSDDVELGDTVRVRDADFGVDLPTRVFRIVRHPLRPQDNVIELDYLQPGLSEVEEAETSRTIDYGELAVLVDDNDTAMTVTSASTTLASIQFTSAGETTVILGGTIKGTTTGTGTVRWSIAVDGVDEVPVYDFAFTTGQQVEMSWPTFVSGIDASNTKTITWRGRIISGSGTIAVAIHEARGWLLGRGAVGIGVNNSPNQAVDETLARYYVSVDDPIALVELFDVAGSDLVDIVEGEDVDVTPITVDDNDAGAPPTVTLI